MELCYLRQSIVILMRIYQSSHKITRLTCRRISIRFNYVCLWTRLFIYLSGGFVVLLTFYSAICQPFFRPFTCLLNNASVCLSVPLFLHSPNHLSVRPCPTVLPMLIVPMSTPFNLSFYPSVCLSFRQSTCLFTQITMSLFAPS